MIKIIADDKIPYLKGVFEPVAEVIYLKQEDIINKNIRDADALIIRTRTKCNAELLEGSLVKFIATTTIGFDHIDTAFCALKGIKWVNAPGCNSSSVQQYLASVLLTIAKLKNFVLDRKTIGIVGVGNVGSKVETIARLLGMNVLLNDPPRERKEGSKKFVPLDQLIDESDIITFHVPLNRDGIDKTFHLADENFFKKFNNSKILINTSRGEIVDTISLNNAVRSGVLFASIVDVWENEPNIDLEQLSTAEIATPHIAGYSAEGKANGTAVCVRALSEFFNLRIDPNWYPSEIPVPTTSQIITIDAYGKSKQEIFYEAVTASYPISLDHIKILNSPEQFEKLRDDYSVRREFSFYNIRLIGGYEEISNELEMLGFKVQNSK